MSISRKKAKKLREWEEARLRRETKTAFDGNTRFSVTYEKIYEDMVMVSSLYENGKTPNRWDVIKTKSGFDAASQAARKEDIESDSLVTPKTVDFVHG
jgi:hypothetical protein